MGSYVYQIRYLDTELENGRIQTTTRKRVHVVYLIENEKDAPLLPGSALRFPLIFPQSDLYGTLHSSAVKHDARRAS